jgi:hypothetical protein
MPENETVAQQRSRIRAEQAAADITPAKAAETFKELIESAAPTPPSTAPDLDAIREALKEAQLDRPCDLYPEDSEYNCVAHPVVYGEVCGPCAIRALLSALDEERRRAEAYDDAVRALAEIDGGAPLSTTIGYLIRSGVLRLHEG